MSRRAVAGIIFVGVLACAGWAMYKVEKGRESLRSALASDLPPNSTPPSTGPKIGLDSAAGSGASAAHDSKPESKTDLTTAAPAPPDAGAIKPGEILDYTANISKLNNVATLRLQVADNRDFLGKPAWHLQAFAHTQNPLRMVFELDDRFDSYSESSAFTSLQYEMHLSERGQKVESVQRMTVTGKEPASAEASQTRVLPGTRDPLGMMQFLRTVDWSKTPEVEGPVYDGHKLYVVHATPAGTESVTVAAGTYNASKIDIRVFDNGAEMKDAKFALYLSKDAARTPVLLEAVLPFANARVELTKGR
jgi:Protein of unknown function (DUF3108)